MQDEQLLVSQSLSREGPLAIIAVDLNGDVRVWNAGAERMFGWSASQVCHRPLRIQISSSEEQLLTHLTNHQQSSDFAGVFGLIHRDGAIITAGVWRSPWRDESGTAIGEVLTIAELPDPGQSGSNTSLDDSSWQIESYLRFRDLLEAAPDAIFKVDQEGAIVLMNVAAEKMFGYDRDELLGQLIEVLVPHTVRKQHVGHRNRYAEAPTTRPMGTGLPLFARRKDGTSFPVEISLSPIHSSYGQRTIAIVRDISARKEIERQTHAIHEQYTAQLTATNQQLELRNREVERANRLKSEFLASMSHELRTPLHTIIGFADILSEKVKGPLNESQERFVEHIRRDSRHLLELINDILDLSKIEAGRLELHQETFGTASAIEETIESIQNLAMNKKIRLVKSIDPDLTINGDRLRFKEILYNLLSNSVKFTESGGEIRIESWKRDQHTAGFAVTDTGIGIPESEHATVFDKFYQVGSTTRGVREGTGLGLAITKSLVEMHGGTITLKSKPRQGSRFEFTLSLGPSADASDPD
jgi:PAS domain S-box-containing protein